MYERATVANVVIEDVRNNERVLLDDAALAADLFHRAKDYLPAELDAHRLVGFNERWRFYRYQPGQTFKPHRDGSYMRMKPRGESELTFMIYLNDAMNSYSLDIHTFAWNRNKAWRSCSSMPSGTRGLSYRVD